MTRLILLLTGALGVWFTWTLLNDEPTPARRRVRAQEAAEQLRNAWEDHHTRA